MSIINNPNWDESLDPDEITYCKDCGKKIWAYWHADCVGNVNTPAKRKSMTLCAPCFFAKEGEKKGGE
jgi:hypothetical protein